MPGKDLNKFFLSIVFPSILAIGLFILTIFIVILPSVERNIMDKKKEMISELTNTAWSLLEEYDLEYKNQNFSKEDAQKTAASRIEKIRYGKENKDYFWIIDQHPTMIMHPYRSELINSDLSDYKDPNGKKLFVEATNIVKQEGEGYINYMWQWKDDSTRIVPKLSYVRGYEPWGWIVGTGIYLEDVKEEIKILKNRLLKISFIITLIITIILLFVIRQSLNIENKRKDAEAKLLLSRQKYKSLVEASTEGTLLILNQTIIFSNLKFNKLAGYDGTHIAQLKFEDLFDVDWSLILSSFSDPKKSVSLDTRIKCMDNTRKDVVISVSKIKYAGDDGYIVITKEISQQEVIEKETEQLSQELQTSLLLMNQSIRHLINDILKCDENTSIHDAAGLMTRKNRNVLFVQKNNNIIGVINNSDLKRRVVAENLNTQKSVLEIMTSPVISIPENALIYEAVLVLRNNNISHLAVKNGEDVITGVISYKDIADMQQNSVSYLIKEIEVAEDIDVLLKIHNRVPVLVSALIEIGDKTQNITRILTSVTDAITSRILALAIEDMGNPPCEFAFMVMGSEGRMEQTLSTDQDNAIVFEEPDPDKLNDAYHYFQKLGQQVNQNLNLVGYKLCDGEIMAKNPKWTQPLSVWKEYFSDWINTSDPQSILEASIFFDFRCVFGNNNIIQNLRNHVNQVIENKSVFFYHMAQSIVKFKPPVSLFGNIIDKNHSNDHINLDIKKILLSVIGFIRLYALHNKLNETNSLSRIKQLYKKQIINKAMYNELVLSYNYLMQLRFRFQTMGILQNKIPDNLVDLNKLTHIEVATIKKIFGEISNLQTKINFDFKGTM
ncbi:MAG: cache domain-containing protein [Bacteroidales bacterium]|nr:cache domain-containing protein [Bacteroidales bacterium]